jgi:hypothetical protein
MDDTCAASLYIRHLVFAVARARTGVELSVAVLEEFRELCVKQLHCRR